MEFPFVTKSAWLAQVTKDLKGQPLESLHWQVSAGIMANPLVAAEDQPVLPYPISETTLDWEICEQITHFETSAGVVQAAEALRGGAEGLSFCLTTAPDENQMLAMFQDIHMDYIGLHFEGPGVVEAPGLILALLAITAHQKGVSTMDLKGSLAYAPIQQPEQVDWRYLRDLVLLGREQFPGVKTITIEEGATGASPEQSLATMLNTADTYIRHLSQMGVPAPVTAATIQFNFTIAQHYFVEIARLRAFQVLWFNLLKGWAVPAVTPETAVVFNRASYTDALYTNMIKATTMAMSAALGGAKRITVMPYDEDRETLATHPKAFARRIARNVQHLLKLESGMTVLSDPAAGGYYLEDLTQQISTQAWRIFQK